MTIDIVVEFNDVNKAKEFIDICSVSLYKENWKSICDEKKLLAIIDGVNCADFDKSNIEKLKGDFLVLSNELKKRDKVADAKIVDKVIAKIDSINWANVKGATMG